MRFKLTLILFIFSVITITTSCNKEDPISSSVSSKNSESSSPINFIQLDSFVTPGTNINNIYELTQAFAIYKGKTNSINVSYKFQLILTSPEFVIHPNNSGTIDSISDSESAHYIVIEIFSLDSNKISIGNYQYVQNSSAIPFHLTANFIQINGVNPGQNGLIFNNILEGEVSIINNNNEHEIYFNTKHSDWDSNGVITAYYKGSFEYYNE
jgi:hypothetical protein